MPNDNTLRPFEGRPVIGTQIAVTNAGDGLSESLNVEPEELPLGITVYVVLECEVTQVRYREVKDTEALIRSHTLKAGTGTIVDAGLVQDVLADQAARNLRHREEKQGVQRLPIDDPDDDDPDDDGDDIGTCDRCGKTKTELEPFDDRLLCGECLDDSRHPSAAANADAVVRDIVAKTRKPSKPRGQAG